jgi:hypothetical protein
LQVRVLANIRTGLSQPDTFLFGAAPGDVYVDPIAQRINAFDLNSIRAAISTRTVGVSRLEDINKDGIVSSQDLQSSRNLLAASAGLRWITLATPLITAASMTSSTTQKSGLNQPKVLANEDSTDLALTDIVFE